MGCAEVNSLPIDEILNQFGFQSVRRTKAYCLYNSPLRQDKKPSFVTYQNSNKYKDFATGEVGTVTDFIMNLKGCSVSEAIKLIKEKKFEIPKPIQEFDIISKSIVDKKVITQIQEVRKYSLLNYAKSREISEQTLDKFAKEINYQNTSSKKNFFSIGISNEKGGWELKSKGFKSSINGKSFSFFKGTSKTIWITEGMFDFFSLIELKNEMDVKLNDNFLILNSISNYVKAKQIIHQFEKINGVLDNDPPGKELSKKIAKEYSERYQDFSMTYSEFKDLNDYLIHQNNCLGC